MPKYPSIILKPGKDEPVKRFHPWIFSGAIRESSGGIEEGDIVEVFSTSGEYLATGHAQRNSIAVKIISYQQRDIDKSFWKEKLLKSFLFRENLGFTGNPGTNAYRLVFGEGDLLPGLVIDYLNGTIVIQCHSVGMYLAKELLEECLSEIYEGKLKSVFNKSAESLAKNCGYDSVDGFLNGSELPDTILENGLIFHVDLLAGQKTGYFLDQRRNRGIVASYAMGRKVLDLFCYSGSFSANALRAGALMADAVDSSKQAALLAGNNLRLNNFDPATYNVITSDAKNYLDNMGGDYDLIILDPPAFAKHHSMKQQAIKGYRTINAQAFKKINKNGIIATFSCSQAIDRQLFESVVLSAAIDAGRQVKIIERLSQPADHPVNIFHPEGEYLKGMILFVE